MRPVLCALSSVASAVLFCLALMSPPSASASSDPLGSGTTTLALAAPFKRLLASHGVALQVGGSARGHGKSFALPLATGAVDPIAGHLTFEGQGRLVFTRGRRRVIFRHVKVRSAPVPLTATVGGGQLKVAKAARRHFARRGFSSTFDAEGLRLTAKVAIRLSKKLDLHDVFLPGQLLGSLHSRVAPATVAVLPEGRTSFVPDPNFLAKLDSLFVSVNPVSPAERQPGPQFTLPFVPAGTIAPDASAGLPRTGGSLEFLQLGAGQVFWHELWFDLTDRVVLAEVDEEPAPPFPGKVGQLPILELDTSAATVSSDQENRIVSLSGMRLTLTSQTAASFNAAFAKPQGKGDFFMSGETVASVSFSAVTE